MTVRKVTKMKKYLLAACFALAGFSPAYADYAAIAAGMKGSSYVQGYATMDGARNAAVFLCRQTWGTSCSHTTAEQSNWYFAAGTCFGEQNGWEPYTAASPQSVDRAHQLVFAKGAVDGRLTCNIYATH